MALEAVPLLAEDSLLSWELETTFKTVASGSTWRSFGRAIEFTDLGPNHAVFRDAIAGAGREAHAIGFEGTNYGPVSQGPWQVVDPKILAMSWGEEENAPTALGGGFFRHTARPTQNGLLPSMSIQMVDLKAGAIVDGTTYLGVIQPDLTIRGEEANDDGSGGRVMFSPTWLGHNDDKTVAKKGVTLETVEPYRKKHANIEFFNTDTDWRIHSWELSLSNNVTSNHYHRNADNDKPFESPPEGITYDLSMEIIADGHQASDHSKILRDLVRDKVTGQGLIKYIRTANQDEWGVRLTDIILQSANKTRRRGKVRYAVTGIVRATTFEWVDTSATRFLPA